jgi:hypothetical protein
MGGTSPVTTPRKRSVALILSSVAAGISVFAALIAFNAQAKSERDQLCDVMYAFVTKSGAATGSPGSPGYAYYQTHPDELRAARKQNQELVGELPCRPSTKGRP